MSINHIASSTRTLLHKIYTDIKETKVSIEDVIKYHNKMWFDNLGSEHIEEITKLIQEDNMYIADFEVKDGYVQAIKYEPFTCEFTTSGRIIVENDLRNFFKQARFDINTTKGIIETMDHYAKQGMLHGFVGNSCPGVYLHSDGYINIGCDHNIETYEPIIPEGFKKLTSICTDLWWYSIVDVEVLKTKFGFDEKKFNIVEIPKGIWKLTHKYGISENGYHENLPYATLELLK